MRTWFGWMAILVELATALPVDAAGPPEDFGRMSPTVQVICYKRTRTDQILPMSFGSGSVISRGGEVLTNYHVVFDADEQRPYEAFEVALTFDLHRQPVRRFTARLAAYDRSLDVALLRLNRVDAMGREVPPLRHVDWNARIAPRQGQDIQVLGYPASGGETLTISRGQISGFERLNEHPCFKTDTDIDHGSSGGTVLDSRGRFIGIPALLRSFAENVGYVLDIRAARPWIAAHLQDETAVDAVAEARLTSELAAFVRANDERVYRTDRYPRLEMRLPEGWRFEEIGDDSIVVGQEAVVDPAGIGIHIDRRPFPVDTVLKARLQEDIDRGKESCDDFAQEGTTFAGVEAWRITFTTGRERCALIHAFFGSAVVHVVYQTQETAHDRQQQAIEQALAGFSFLDSPASPPPPPRQEFTFREPDCMVLLPDGWGGRLNPGSEGADLLLTAWQRGNSDGEMTVSYRRIPPAKQRTGPTQRLREAVDGTFPERIVRKQEDVLVDGLPGWLVVAEQNGQELKDLRRRLQLVLLHGTHEFVLEYGDAAANFERNAADVLRFLNSFQVRGEQRENRGAYRVGALSITFRDIRNHRFEEAIASLASRDLLKAYSGNCFEPEAAVTRARALRTAIDARNRLAAQTRPARVLPLVTLAGDAGFSDLPPDHWAVPYARCARERRFLPLATGDRFEPERSVSLEEGLRLLFAVFEVPLWNGPAEPAWKPVLDKGYELDLIPRGLDAPDHVLTNAEMAGLVEAISACMEQ